MQFKALVFGVVAGSAMAAPYIAVPQNFEELRALVPVRNREMFNQAAIYISQMASDFSSDINLLDGDVKALAELLGGFKGEKDEAEKLSAGTEKLNSDMRTVIKNVKRKKFSLGDAAGVGTVMATFLPDSVASVEALTGKKELIDKAGMTKQVHDSLVVQRKLGDDLNDAILGALPSFLKSFGQGQNQVITGPMDEAIKTFAQVGPAPKTADSSSSPSSEGSGEEAPSEGGDS